MGPGAGMAPWHPNASSFRRRLVGLYALTIMEREGPVHGYGISERIAERTDGAWRPGPGAVYPSLKKLVLSGFARSRAEGRRRVYAITPKGRAFLAQVRDRSAGFGGSRPDVGTLWAEVMGTEGVEGLLLLRLRRTVDAIESHLDRNPDAPPLFREHAASELAQALVRLREAAPAARRAKGGHRAR